MYYHPFALVATVADYSSRQTLLHRNWPRSNHANIQNNPMFIPRSQSQGYHRIRARCPVLYPLLESKGVNRIACWCPMSSISDSKDNKPKEPASVSVGVTDIMVALLPLAQASGRVKGKLTVFLCSPTRCPANN